jgi:hypothetical protein
MRGPGERSPRPIVTCHIEHQSGDFFLYRLSKRFQSIGGRPGTYRRDARGTEDLTLLGLQMADELTVICL